jgi:hypothetical protein
MSSRADNLKNLIVLQRNKVPDIGLYGKMTFFDLKRVDLLISGDITKSSNCCLYKGHIKNSSYCTFSFKGKKTSVLRLLYHNMISDINPNVKIKYSCENKGICCNLSHFYMDDEETPEIEKSDTDLADDPEIDVDDDQNIFNLDI